jgi:hypothetical protein
VRNTTTESAPSIASGSRARKPFAILRPVDEPWIPEPRAEDILAWPIVAELPERLAPLLTAKCVVLDCETKGTETWLATTEIVGLGLAWLGADDEVGAVYINWTTLPIEGRRLVWNVLRSVTCDLVAHNAPFDSALCSMQMDRDYGQPTPWSEGNADPTGFAHRLPFSVCTFAAYKALASEGWPGQSWSLESAQLDLLRWPSSNKDAVGDWLIAHGYIRKKQWAVTDADDDATRAKKVAKIQAKLEKVLAGKVKNDIRADKGQLWRVPADLLGRYCLLDCFSTLDLWLRVLRPALDRFPELDRDLRGAWMSLVRQLADQQYTGIRTSRHLLTRRRARLRAVIAVAEAELRADPTVGPRIAQLEARWLAEATASVASKEPARTKKDGSPSKRWSLWKERVERAPANAKRWSSSSKEQTRALLYGSAKLGLEPLVRTESGDRPEPPKRRGTFWMHGRHGRVELELTKSGALAVGKDTVAQLPDPYGPTFARLAKAIKELEYAEAYLKLIRLHPDRTWRLHPGWVAPGTLTLRLSGKKPSLHQCPKSLELLDALRPNHGCVWLEKDWSSIEPAVLAELSRDEALLALFGPDANPAHDRYLFTLASIPHPMFDGIRRHYNVENPTKEGVAQAKAENGTLREGGKLVVLSDMYGSGVKKKWRTLAAKGIALTMAQVQEVHDGQRALHHGVDAFGAALEREWRARGGFVLTGLGHPAPIFEMYLKDRTNRVVQNTAHWLHVLYLWILTTFLDEAGIPWRGIVLDFHDQVILEIARRHAERAIEIERAASAELNEMVASYVRLKGEPRIVSCMAAAKCEEKFAAREKQRAESKGGTAA